MFVLLVLCVSDVQAQFTAQWLDIGEYHDTYAESGSKKEGAPGIADGQEWPAILRRSSHNRARAFWIGVKDWTDPQGRNYPTYVSRMGPRSPGVEFSFPVQNRLIGKYEDTMVLVDGALSFDNVAVLDEVDPAIPADRMVDNVHNMTVGITTTRKVYAYVNQYHDDYHILDYQYCNTGNTDDDADIELPNQTLHGVYFYRLQRYRQNLMASWVGSGGQVWGKYTMIDVVGDGHEDYPVDFNAQWSWYGFDPTLTDYNNLGGPRLNAHWTMAEGDTVGRLTGPSMIGIATLHADTSPTNKAYDRGQPSAMGWQDQDEALTADGSSHEDYYELGILTRENPARNPGCTTCYTRGYPHYADRVEPSGLFWNPTNDASGGKQGGFAPNQAFGPYEIGPGECVHVAQVEGVAGLSFDAAVQIGRSYKRGGNVTRENKIIQYDANGDGVIDTTPFNFDELFVGTEAQTKNQWVMSARDSMFQLFQRGIDLYAASNEMTTYPIPEAPRAPVEFTVDGRPDKIDLTWTPAAGGPAIDHWEIYRTTRWEDNLYASGCLNSYPATVECGYKLVTSVPAGTTTYADTDVLRGTDYYYYIEGVGQSQPNDMRAINGTPYGTPLRSSRYLTQSYLPTTLKRPPYGQSGTVADARVVPNPVNLGSDQTIRFAQEDRLAFFDIPGECTIKIYTEIGELVKTLEHTDGSGDELWNMTTDSRQLLVSGIYIAVVEDLGNGERAFLKFTVIR